MAANHQTDDKVAEASPSLPTLTLFGVPVTMKLMIGAIRLCCDFADDICYWNDNSRKLAPPNIDSTQSDAAPAESAFWIRCLAS